MRLVADAGRRIGQLAGIGLGVFDHLADRIGREVRMHHQHGRAVGHLGDRREALDRIVSGVFLQRGHHAERGAGRQQQRVAVGLRAGHGFRPGRAAGAGPVLDHDILVQRRLHHLRDHARREVGRAARAEWHHQPDGLARVALRVRRAGRHCERQCNEGGQCDEATAHHALLPIFASMVAPLARRATGCQDGGIAGRNCHESRCCVAERCRHCGRRTAQAEADRHPGQDQGDRAQPRRSRLGQGRHQPRRRGGQAGRQRILRRGDRGSARRRRTSRPATA